MHEALASCFLSVNLNTSCVFNYIRYLTFFSCPRLCAHSSLSIFFQINFTFIFPLSQFCH